MLAQPRSRKRTDLPSHAPGGAQPLAPNGAWPSERKLRLFACACCRRWWRELASVCQRAVNAAERYADGACPVVELEAAWRKCRNAERRGLPDGRTEHVHLLAAAVFTPTDAATVATDLRPWRGISGDNDVVDDFCGSVWEDVFGGPAGTVSPLWVTDTARALAGDAYARREFSAMPILADALQDAGCDNELVLDHLRGPGPHVRGCWVVDQVLGKG